MWNIGVWGGSGTTSMPSTEHSAAAGRCVLMAGLLGFGGPKRLVPTFLATASVSDGGLGDVADVTLVVVYIVVVTAPVSVPVGIVIVAGERAAGRLARGHAWLTGREVWLRVWLSTGIGVALLVDGLVRLVV
jgi:hypothetical protein